MIPEVYFEFALLYMIAGTLILTFLWSLPVKKHKRELQELFETNEVLIKTPTNLWIQITYANKNTYIPYDLYKTTH